MTDANQIPDCAAPGSATPAIKKNNQQADADQNLKQSIVSQRQKSAADSGNFELEDGLFRRFNGKLVSEIAWITEL
jgi:hypothetical protein